MSYFPALGGVTFPLNAPDGTAAAPEYAFTGATGTGVYRDAGTGDLRVAGGGAWAVGVATDGTVTGFENAGGTGIPWSLGKSGFSSGAAALYVGSHLGSADATQVTLYGTATTTVLNVPGPSATFGHLQWQGTDFVLWTHVGKDQLQLGSASGNVTFNAATPGFGLAQGVVAIADATTSLTVASAPSGWSSLYSQSTTNGTPQGLVVVGTEARTSVAPKGQGAIQSQKADKLTERIFATTLTGTTNAVEVDMPVEDGTINGTAYLSGRMTAPGTSGAAGDYFMAEYQVRAKIAAGVVTNQTLTLVGAATNAASMAGGVQSLVAVAGKLGFKVDATALAGGAAAAVDWCWDVVLNVC